MPRPARRRKRSEASRVTSGTVALAEDERAGDAGGVMRRCIVTGEIRPKQELIRFVVGPDGKIVPDIAGNLPGRGLWLTARRDIVAMAVAKRLFAKAARAPVDVEADLADLVERLLAARCCGILGLARRAGRLVAGFEKVRAMLAGGEAAVLVEAMDGGADSRGKLEARARGAAVVDCLRSAEMSAALGRDHVVHAALERGRFAASLVVEAARLDGFRQAAFDRTEEANGTGSQ